MIADTSAWVEFLRGTGHRVAAALTRLIEMRRAAVTDVVVMEILMGARSESEARRLRHDLLGLPVVTLRGLRDFEEAASMYRACRSAGATIRSIGDCLIAVAVIRAGAEILHNDRDFDAIARHTGLRIYPVAA